MAFGNPDVDLNHPLTGNLVRAANPQLSAYDNRPDSERPFEQGVLFRREAQARGTERRCPGLTSSARGWVGQLWDSIFVAVTVCRSSISMPRGIRHGYAAAPCRGLK